MTKKIIALLLTVLLTLTAKADSWDDMSFDQAERVVSFLKKNPYILDYCDCCGPSGRLFKVTSLKIITSPYDPYLYSVEVNGKAIANIVPSDGLEVNFKTTAIETSEKSEPFNISMNYTFVYNNKSKLAVCFFDIIDDYRAKNTCSEDKIIHYPKLNGVKNRKYSKWYKKTIGLRS